MKMPDITPAMIATFVGQVIAVAVAFGVNLNPDQQKAILAVAATIGAVLLWADVQLRKNRAQNADRIALAQAAAQASVPRAFDPEEQLDPPAPTDTAPAPTTLSSSRPPAEDSPFEKPQMQEIGRNKPAPKQRRRAAKP